MDQIQQEDTVYDSNGDDLGKVVGIAPDYLIVQKGWAILGGKQRVVPMSAVTSCKDGQVRLNLSKDSLQRI